MKREEQLNLKIDSRNVQMTPRWKTEIEKRVAALEPDTLRPTHTRVTLTKNPHHKKGDDNAEALVVLSLPRKHTITARKEAKTFEEAIRAAFSAAQTEMRKLQEKRSIVEEREPDLPLHGVISKLFQEKGYGFILQDGGGEVYFHRNVLNAVDFEKLEDGEEVAFDIRSSEKGLQATKITLTQLRK